MNVIQENDTALVEVPYEGNENYPAGSHVYEWRRSAIGFHKKGFEVLVYVEGYRIFKDTWLHATYPFATLAEALTFYHTINNATSDEQDELLGLEDSCKYNGWYGLTVEGMQIYEYSGQGEFQWEKHYESRP